MNKGTLVEFESEDPRVFHYPWDRKLALMRGIVKGKFGNNARLKVFSLDGQEVDFEWNILFSRLKVIS